MNKLSRRKPTCLVEHGAPTKRWLFVACALGVTVFSGCDSPPAEPEASNDQPSDAGYSPNVNPCDAGEVWTNHGCVQPAAVKLNTVGYLIGREKTASVPADVSDLTFALRDVSTQQQVYSGSLSADATDVPDTGDTVRFADFTAFDEPGTYVLEVNGLPASPQFEIGDTVYNDVLRLTLLGLYGQRCGVAISLDHDGDTFAHSACHLNDAQFDASITPDQSGTRDATGGWHDAGDYGKYTVNAAFSVAFLLKAWEDFGQPLAAVNHIPNYSGSLPSILAEARHELDWLLKMQLADGTVLDLVCPKYYPGDSVSPGGDNAQRFFLMPAAADTAYFAAAMAMASRVFRPFDAAYADEVLAAAERAMTWLGFNTADVPVADGTYGTPLLAGGPYPVAAGDNSPARTWAAVEVWRANGDGDLASIESTLGTMTVASNWDWANAGNFAMFDYAASDSLLRDSATVAKVNGAITSVADSLVSTTQSHGYGRALGSGSYYWGSNGLVARCVMNLQAAYRLSGGAKYLDAATQQVDYLLGRNPFGRSMVTGVGFAPPVNPHHRPSNSDNVDEPWPGLLVGGPNKDQSDPMSTKNPEVPAGKAWWDLASDYYVNEIAINWNGALVYAVAGFAK